MSRAGLTGTGLTGVPAVGVNLLWLVPGRVGGSEQATIRQLEALAELPEASRYQLFCTPEVREAHPEVVGAFAGTEVEVAASSRARRILAEATTLNRAAGEAKVELMHHGGGTLPLRTPLPCTVTIHDIQPIDLPGNIPWLRRWYLARGLPSAARRARRIAVPSTFVRDRVIDRLGADPARVTVIPWGPPRDRPGDGPEAPGLVSSSLLPPQMEYLLYPAVTWPHKGHVAFLDVVAALPGELHLVLTGGEGPAHRELLEAVEQRGLSARVHHLGRVSEAHLDALYRGAVAAVMPSSYEGFGMPVIEAEAAGVPVIASTHPGLDEACGDAALRVDIGDVAGWVAAVQSVRADTQRREALVAAGRRVAAGFNWTDSARALVALHRAAWEHPS